MFTHIYIHMHRHTHIWRERDKEMDIGNDNANGVTLINENSWRKENGSSLHYSFNFSLNLKLFKLFLI